MTPNFSKSKRDIYNKLISVHDSIILLSFGTLFIHIRPWIAAQQSIKIVKHVKIILSTLALLALHDGICGSFHNKATIHASALHCVLHVHVPVQLKTWTKTVLTCFTKIIAEQPYQTHYERPMYHMKEEKKMLSSTHNNLLGW